MSHNGRAYSRGTADKEVSPGLSALHGIEKYVRGLVNEVNEDLNDLNKAVASDPSFSAPKWANVRSRLLAKKHAYRDVLQFIKDGKGIL